MSARSTRRRGFRQIVAADLDLMPLMNLFICMIPMLLLSAVFVQISVIDMGAGGSTANAEPPPEALELTVRIRAEGYVLQGNGLPARVFPRSPGDPASVERARLQLSEALAGVVAQRPDTRDLRILSTESTRYEEIIAVMDLARAAGLPEASLGGGAEGGS
jgi:biopolymer transport protein ExbD